MNTKIWYAITDLQNENNDWGTGSYNYNTAVEMLKEIGHGEISVIALNEDPECKNIITLEEIAED